MHLYCLVTDGVRILAVEEADKLQLPNSRAHWPPVRPTPKTNWPVTLLTHVCYGTLDVRMGPHERLPRPFGLPPGTFAVKWQLSPDDLDRIVDSSRRRRLWAIRYAEASWPWALRAVKHNHADLDLASTHITRATLMPTRAPDDNGAAVVHADAADEAAAETAPASESGTSASDSD
jgi:hypothetical protein